jgi:hypothetical protein
MEPEFMRVEGAKAAFEVAEKALHEEIAKAFPVGKQVTISLLGKDRTYPVQGTKGCSVILDTGKKPLNRDYKSLIV